MNKSFEVRLKKVQLNRKMKWKIFSRKTKEDVVATQNDKYVLKVINNKMKTMDSSFPEREYVFHKSFRTLKAEEEKHLVVDKDEKLYENKEEDEEEEEEEEECKTKYIEEYDNFYDNIESDIESETEDDE